jgi:DNA mismatch endonuclease (patch repair protein)
MPRWQVAVFFHGCFWHGHLGCPLFRLPGTRKEFWLVKIGTNRVLGSLLAEGWRVATVRECAIRGGEDGLGRPFVASLPNG